jgi:TIR domain
MTRFPLARVTTAPKVQIFINYRNDDEPFGAALIDHVLSDRFGPDTVFRAAKSIRPGEDYVTALISGVRRSAVLLVVMGPRWSLPAGDRSRPAGCVDWVRLEIAEAFRHDVRVIPVLLGTDPPTPADLPPDVAPLGRCQYVRIRHRCEAYDINHLAYQLAALVPGLHTAQLHLRRAAG